MSFKVPEKYQAKVQHALEKAVSDASLFPAPSHQAYEPEGINNPLFRSIYDRPTPIPGLNLGDIIPPMAAAEGYTKANEAFSQGNTGTGLMDAGFATLDAIDPSPMAWGAAASGLGTMIGVGAKNFPHESLDIARDIEKAGGGRDEVFQQTGLFRGTDKKWRSEIDDSQARLAFGGANDSEYVGSLDNFMKHAPLYDNYLGMNKIDVAASPRTSGASYKQDPFGDELIDIPGLARNDLKLSSGMHEAQHAIQSREGFARGGSSDNFDTKTVYNDKSLSDIESRTMEDIMEKYNIPGDGFFETPVEFMHRELLPDYGKLMTPRERRSLVDIVNEKVDKQLSPYDQYRNLAGEVEARNVQKRLDYTPEQRRMIPPWMTEDVPLGDQIVNFRGGGKSEMSAGHGSGGVLGDAGKVYGTGKITELDPSMQVAPRVSQRVPTPTQMPDVHQRSDVDINLDAMRQKPEAFEKNMLLMQSNPSMPFSGYRNPDVIAEKSMEHLQDNLRHIKDNTPQEFFDRSGNWYKGANALANDITNAHGVPIQASVGVLARLSPKWDWLKNVPNAERLTNIWKNHGDQRWTSEMSRIAPPALTNKLQGTKLKDLDSLDKALWIRTFDKAHNPQTYQGITPEGLMGDTIMTKSGVPSKHVMQSNMNLSKAINMLEDPSIENISRQLGGGHKIRNFYNNIGDPFYGGDITMDTHAIAADTLSPLGSGAREVDQNFGGLGTGISQGAGGTYGLHADAYRNVADELGIMPSELQSPTWETIRETFLNKPQNAPIVERIWDDVRRGVTTSPEARERIMEHFGGYKMPSWFDG